MASEVKLVSDTIQALRDGGVEVTAAFAEFDPNTQVRRLTIRTPKVGTDGPKAVYEEIARILGARLDLLPLSEITVEDPRRADVSGAPQGAVKLDTAWEAWLKTGDVDDAAEVAVVALYRIAHTLDDMNKKLSILTRVADMYYPPRFGLGG